MDCRQGTSSEVLEGYVAGTLDAAAAEYLELHLLGCQHCVSAIEALEVARQDLASRAHEIRSHAPVKRFDFRFWVPALAAVLVLLVVGGRFLSRRERPSTVSRVSEHVPDIQSQPEQIIPKAAQTQPPKSETATGVAPNPRASTTFAKKAAKPTRPVIAETEVPKIDTTAATVRPEPRAEVVQQTGQAAIPPQQPQKSPRRRSANSSALTEDQARELFRLGDVRVPPSYTAAGEAAGAKPGKPSAQLGIEENTGTSNSGASRFQQAMISYVEKDYRRAGELLELAASASGEQHSPELDFYLGVCRLINGHPDEAKAPLQRVIADGKSSLVPAAHLFLAKAYVQQSALADAESELELASGPPGAIKTEATALLTRLRVLRKSMSDSRTAPTQ